MVTNRAIYWTRIRARPGTLRDFIGDLSEVETLTAKPKIIIIQACRGSITLLLICLSVCLSNSAIAVKFQFKLIRWNFTEVATELNKTYEGNFTFLVYYSYKSTLWSNFIILLWKNSSNPYLQLSGVLDVLLHLELYLMKMTSHLLTL